MKRFVLSFIFAIASRRKHIILRGCCFLVAGCLLASCDAAGIEKSPDVPLMPLAVGNTWTYKNIYSLLPNPVTDTIRYTITEQIIVEDAGRERQAAVRTLYSVSDGQASPIEWLYRNGNDGLYEMGGIAQERIFIASTLQFKYPAEEGTSYTVPYLSYNLYTEEFSIDDTLMYHVLATEEPITTPAGRFTCYVYYYRRHPAPDVGSYFGYYFYYAPGIGPVALIVKQETEDDVDLVSERLLINYHIKSGE